MSNSIIDSIKAMYGGKKHRVKKALEDYEDFGPDHRDHPARNLVTNGANLIESSNIVTELGSKNKKPEETEEEKKKTKVNQAKKYSKEKIDWSVLPPISVHGVN